MIVDRANMSFYSFVFNTAFGILIYKSGMDMNWTCYDKICGLEENNFISGRSATLLSLIPCIIFGTGGE